MIPRLVPATVFAIIAAMARSITTNHPICSVGSCILTPYFYDTNAIVSGLAEIVNTPLYSVLLSGITQAKGISSTVSLK